MGSGEKENVFFCNFFNCIFFSTLSGVVLTNNFVFILARKNVFKIEKFINPFFFHYLWVKNVAIMKTGINCSSFFLKSFLFLSLNILIWFLIQNWLFTNKTVTEKLIIYYVTAIISKMKFKETVNILSL